METYFIGLTVYMAALLAVVHSTEISLQMSSDEPRAIGDDVTFHCRVDDFPSGGAVVWWKRQGQEEVKLGVNGELDIAVDRYSLEVQQANTAVLFYLNIRGIVPEDNGDFGCSLTSEPDTRVYRNLIVSDPVNEIHLYQIASAGSTEVTHEYAHDESFYFHEEQDYYFRCVASGSNPKPEIALTIGYQDDTENLNDKFDRADKLISDATSGEVAFRKTNFEGTLTANTAIKVDWKANSQEFKCSASVPNMETPMSLTIKPILKISPIIECAQSTMKVPIWTTDVSIECAVYADPELQDIRWYWGNEYRATSLTPGESSGAFTFHLVAGSKPDMKIARLTIDQVFIQMFQQFNLAAKNDKGLSVQSVTLVQDTKKAVKASGAELTSVLSWTLLLVTSFLSVHLHH